MNMVTKIFPAREIYRDGLEDARVLAKVLDDPGQDAGGGVAGGEDDADDVVGDLLVGEALLVAHEGPEQVIVVELHLPPGDQDLGQDLSQLLPGLHGLVEQGAREVDGH